MASKQTYENSYLFSEKDVNAANERRKLLTEFILKYDRIEDKNSDAFRGVVEDVKRMQRTSTLYSVLMSSHIILCYGQKEMPAAFKVFEARDLRTDREPKIFIDVTGLITFKDGYYSCRKVDVLVSYLFCALDYLLYSNSGVKMMNNSAVSISGTECFVSMFTAIIDYLRIIGYSNNKEKISYLAGLYFLYHMMGKDLDTYTKNIAAKAAGLSTTDTKPFELYYNPEEDFKNIDTFVTMISKTFKLKGFDTEVFVAKWMYYFKATGYDTELFTSFANLIINAFSGSYIVNQKQIERCCGASMVKFCNAIMQMGADYDNRAFMEFSEFDKTVARDKNTEALKTFVNERASVPAEAKISKSDYASKTDMKTKVNNMVSYYRSVQKEDKILQIAVDHISSICKGMNKEFSEVADGVLTVLISGTKSYLKSNSRKEYVSKAINTINESSGKYSSLMKKARDTGDKEKAKFYAKRVAELQKCKNML